MKSALNKNNYIYFFYLDCEYIVGAQGKIFGKKIQAKNLKTCTALQRWLGKRMDRGNFLFLFSFKKISICHLL